MSIEGTPSSIDTNVMTREEFENEKNEATNEKADEFNENVILNKERSKFKEQDIETMNKNNLNDKKMVLDQLQNDVALDNINLVNKTENDQIESDTTPPASHVTSEMALSENETKNNEDMNEPVKNFRQLVQTMCNKYNLDYDSTEFVINNLCLYFRKKNVKKFDEAFLFELIDQGIQAVEEVTEMVTTINGVHKQELLVDILMLTIEILLGEKGQQEEYARLVALMKVLVPTVASVIIGVTKNIGKYQKTLQNKCKKMCC
jgi:hypothetical protein